MLLFFRPSPVFFILSCAVASAAALAPIPGPKSALPVAALEVNRGQAKPEILFLSRGAASVAVTPQSVLYSPLGVGLSFLGSNPDPTVRFVDSLPGVVNSFTGVDPQKWVTGIPRYATAHLAEVYPGIDVQYVIGSDGQLTMKLLLWPGIDPKPVVFEIAKALSIDRTPDGSLVARFGTTRFDPALVYPPPSAFQEEASGRASRSVSFEVQSRTRFGFQVEGPDSALPLQIELKLGGATPTSAIPRHIVDAAGNLFVVVPIPDAAGKDAPFPAERWEGCGTSIGFPIPCWDAAVYKFSRAGNLIFASYLAGRTREAASFLRLSPDGALIVTGTTDSADFPVNATALQKAYGGPAPAAGASLDTEYFAGDFFAAKLDAATGALLAATYLGGPNADRIGETVLGADGSVYFLPKWLGQFSARMPVSPGALQRDCTGDPCANGYAARISPSLDRLLYGTYLPGRVQATAKLHSDGSVYYAGAAGPGFPVTPAAYQRQAAGKEDGIVARLDPSGSSLMFATYLGAAETDWILRMAVAPDGSVWAAVSSFVQCCINTQSRLVRLDAKGERILAEKPIDVGDLAVDREGNLHATAAGKFTVGPDAFLANACAWSYLASLLSGKVLCIVR